MFGGQGVMTREDGLTFAELPHLLRRAAIKSCDDHDGGFKVSSVFVH